MNNNNLHVGTDSVVMGNVQGNIGDGSVVIGPTDSNGNTILNQTMAVGRNARAGHGSIAIGVNAMAGSEVIFLLDQLKNLIDNEKDTSVSTDNIITLINELNKTAPDRSLINNLWDTVKKASSINGAIGLINRISVLIGL